MSSSLGRIAPVALSLAVLLAASFPAARGQAQSVPNAAADAPIPVVVELFTSQGCSSCPPADALLTDLVGRPDVIPLSLHVDYWDYIGWKDPYGSPMNTARQRRYAESLGLPYIYTPQIVVDGRTNVVGSHRAEVLAAIREAKTQGKHLTLRFLAGGGGKVVIPAGHAPDVGATIWLAVYDRSHSTEIKRGENAGRKIQNSNVVREFERIGTWTGERLEIPLNMDEAAERGRYGCAVIVQQGRNGPVLGAAAMNLANLR